MPDRISSLPDLVLCHILSFLPTKLAVATSVLSKRWKPLWRSVPTFDFNFDFDDNNDDNNQTYFEFVQSVYTFIITRDMDQPLQRFRLMFRSRCDKTAIVNSWLTAAIQRRLEHLDLFTCKPFELLSAVLSCKTLVFLKLTDIDLDSFSSIVNLPSLKTLNLAEVEFSERARFAEFLSGTPNLEDLEMDEVYFPNYVTEAKFKSLPKLLRAVIMKNGIPLDIVHSVQFLHIREKKDIEVVEDPIPEFHNLTHIEFGDLDYTKYCLEVLEVLNHCPKLQSLFIEMQHSFYPVLELDLGDDWPCPPCVPKCISLHLKTCCLISYKGTAGQFKFAKFIMQNARALRDMIIWTYAGAHDQEKFEMMKELSLCTRLSSTCKLSFN